MNDCDEWTGARIGGKWGGYGNLSIAGVSVLAHRLVWMQDNGPIPDGMLICHSCDNPPCINLEHLFLGSPKDNMQDMFAKGRKPSKTKCAQGHLFDDENTMYSRGQRYCRTCQREHYRKYYEKNRERELKRMRNRRLKKAC